MKKIFALILSAAAFSANAATPTWVPVVTPEHLKNVTMDSANVKDGGVGFITVWFKYSEASQDVGGVPYNNVRTQYMVTCKERMIMERVNVYAMDDTIK